MMQDTEEFLTKIANNIAWMYNFRKIDKAEIKAAIIDITLFREWDEELISLVHQKYLEIIEEKKPKKNC
jgi:hypothetical protein